jgi:hypothetical protein
MGALFQGRCYTTQVEATDAFFTSTGPQYVATGTNSGQQTFYYAKYVSGWYVCVESVNSTAAPVCTIATAPVFPPCDESLMNPSPAAQFADGVTIGWGIVTAMALAFSIKLLQKALS